MDEDEYNRICKNLEKENKYNIRDGILYRKEKDKWLKIIRKHEFEGLRGVPEIS